MEITPHGPLGLNALSLVAMEQKLDSETAQIHHQNMAERTAQIWVPVKKF